VLDFMAGATGLEPATSSVTGQRESNEINSRFNSQLDNGGDPRFDVARAKVETRKDPAQAV
jgi:hypothetical protein